MLCGYDFFSSPDASYSLSVRLFFIDLSLLKKRYHASSRWLLPDNYERKAVKGRKKKVVRIDLLKLYQRYTPEEVGAYYLLKLLHLPIDVEIDLILGKFVKNISKLFISGEGFKCI